VPVRSESLGEKAEGRAETWFEESDPEGVAFEHEVLE
jgi:hypothetical protein